MAEPHDTPQPTLRPWVPIVAAVLVLGLVGFVVFLPRMLSHIPLPSFPQQGDSEGPTGAARLPEAFSKPAFTYGTPAPDPPAPEPEPPKPKPPVAQYVSREPKPAPAAQPNVMDGLVATQSAIMAALQQLAQRQEALEHRPVQAEVVAPAPTPAGPPQAKPEDPRKKSWEYLAKGKETREARLTPKEEKEALDKAQAQDLVKPARWAIPQYPLKTIYRSQTLTGRLLQAMSSDVPGGQVKIQLTTPVLDRFSYDTTIVPKDSIVIAIQEGGSPRYGQSRLAIRLEQLEFPSGEIVNFKAMIGDENGANGTKGTVDNHVGKLVLATGLSAILNIGVRAAAGTPGENRYYQNPIQSSAQDIGQSVQQDAKSIVDRELRIPPTITVPAGAACTINLQENVQFSKAPIVVR